jgi:hypothetical protein
MKQGSGYLQQVMQLSLKNEVEDADLQQLMLAIITNPEEVEVDMKSIKAELKKDNLLLLQLGIAKELGYSLVRLNQEVTMEELLLWSCYFDLQNEEQERRMKRRR